MKLEICVTTVQCAINACQGGADQLELCSAWELGGLTPSRALIEEVKRSVDIPVKVLIRPRPGYFQYSNVEKKVMLRDVSFCCEQKVEGVVVGSLLPNNMLDLDFISQVCKETQGTIDVTIHRAFDFCDKSDVLYEELSRLGVSAVMTSGGENKTAVENLVGLKNILNHRLPFKVIAAGGINENNICQITSECPSLDVIHSPANMASNETISHFGMTYLVDKKIVQKLRYYC